MQDIVKQFLQMVIRRFPIHDPIYEIGAFQVPGQEGYADLRPYFPGKTYVGCDMRPGPGVDRIEDVHKLSLEDKSVKTLIIMDTLEHVTNPFKAMDEIYRVLSDKGLLILSVPFNFHIHDYPSDYWRFTPSSIELLLGKFEFYAVLWERHPSVIDPIEVYAVAIKKDYPSPEVIHELIREARSRYEIKIHHNFTMI